MNAPVKSQISIIPAMIIVATLAFSVRLVDVYAGFSSLNNVAHASSTTEAPAAEMAAEATGEAKPEDAAMDAKETVPPEEELTKWRDANEEDFGFNSIKLEHLQNLDERRKELDKKEKELQEKEAMIKAAQQEMSRKYLELTQLRSQIEGLLDNQKQEEQEQIQSLVTIYEGMKAKEAAAIFNSLDLDILVEVMRNMSERKASPILAKMNPERAKTVTIMLAQQKKLPTLEN